MNYQYPQQFQMSDTTTSVIPNYRQVLKNSSLEFLKRIKTILKIEKLCKELRISPNDLKEYI